MSLITVSIKDILAKAPNRPDGYEADMLNSAHYTDAEFAYYVRDVLDRLSHKYAGKAATLISTARSTIEVQPLAAAPSWWDDWQRIQEPEPASPLSPTLAKLHADYHKELRPDGQACAGCQRSTIVRKYQQLVQNSTVIDG